MRRFFSDYDVVKLLSERLGIKKTAMLLQKNIVLQRKHLTSADVACLYDEFYHNSVADHVVTRRHNSYAINYYTQFAFDYLNTGSNVGKTLLDFGCGRGELALALASTGVRVLGIDFDKKAIDAANTKKNNSGRHLDVRFEVGNIMSLEEKFDYVVFSDVVEHLSKDELVPILHKAADLLAEEGELVIHTPNGNVDPFLEHPLPRSVLVRSFWWLRGLLVRFDEGHLRNAFYMQVHINVMTPRELTELLSIAGFRDVNVHLRNERHSWFRRTIATWGLSADLGVVARKRRLADVVAGVGRAEETRRGSAALD